MSGLSEELALEQRLGERRAVDADERSGGAARRAVDAIGDDLLAGAGLAEDEDVDVAGSDEAHEALDALHR